MKSNVCPSTVFLMVLTLAIIVFYVSAAIFYPNLYIYGTYEDLYGEWAQTYFFVATFIIALLNALQKNHPYRWFFTLLAIASFYVSMEEISWGQRLIGFETPDYFQKHSYQNEANIHNLLSGPVKVWTKTLLTYIVACGLVGYGIIFPLAVKAAFKPAIKLLKWGIHSPVLALIPAFFAAALLETEPFSFNEAEIAELLVAMALAYTALHYLPARTTNSSLAYPLTVLIIVSTAVFITTQILLNTPTQRNLIEQRLANGYNKFVDRYEGYGYTPGVVATLQRYNQLKPNNTVVLRKIADNLEVLGRYNEAQLFIQAAIQEGLRRYQQDPTDVQTNVSLAKSYRQAGDYGKMEWYSEQAYRLAKTKQEKNPNSAHWAFWLAKACEQAHRQKEALNYYRLAHKLEPRSSHYYDAYYQKKQLMLDYED